MLYEIVGYQVIFAGQPEEPAALLEGVPSKYVIGLLSTLTNTLERKGNSRRTQWELLEAMMKNFSDDVRKGIIGRLLVYEKRRGRFTIFENRYLVEMIQREYLSFKAETGPEFYENPEAAELEIFKAYALIIDQTTVSDNEGLHEAIEDSKKDAEYGLYRILWPYFGKQFEFTVKADHLFEAFKGLGLLNFLSRSAEYGAYAAAFFAKFHKKDAVDYIGRMLLMIHSNLMKQDTGDPFDHFIQFEQDSTDPLVRLLTVNPSLIASDTNKQKDYIGMKERPMYEYGENRYLVPYWVYLYTSLYPGLLFTFHRESGLRKREDFSNFKRWLGLHFSEQFLFRRLIDRSFSESNVVRYYTEESFNPDCFMRAGRDVFIIEFKDNLVTADVVQSLSFDKFKATVDKAFIESDGKKGFRPKGISQLARLLETFRRKCEQGDVSDDFCPVETNFSGLVIYPIVVYTNFYFDMPGVNDYLRAEFQKRFPQLLNENIMPVTTINLHYFYARFLSFADGDKHLKDELEAYNAYSMNRKKLATETGTGEDRLASAPSFGEWANILSSTDIGNEKIGIRDELIKLWEIG